VRWRFAQLCRRRLGGEHRVEVRREGSCRLPVTGRDVDGELPIAHDGREPGKELGRIVGTVLLVFARLAREVILEGRRLAHA
jgi:hypothetical protein